MTNIEKEAGWINKERQSVVKIANEINKMVLLHNFALPHNQKHLIDYSIGTAGNSICVRISDGVTCSTIETKEIWGLSDVFEYPTFMYGSRERLSEKIAELKNDLLEMKKFTQKYIALNTKK